MTAETMKPDVVYWHRQLPPLEAETVGEHTVEATSHRVPGTISHRDELWDSCYADLMRTARHRLEQEVTRLNGRFAHVLDESVDGQQLPRFVAFADNRDVFYLLRKETPR